MKYLVIVFGVIIFILLAIIIFVPAQKSSKGQSQPTPITTIKSDKEIAIEKAESLFEEKKGQGLNFDNGPCLSEEIIPDWVVDIAHNPRAEVDNKPENQCQSYRQGKTHHFVELDPEGNLIRAI